MRLNGWQRLWVSASILYLIVVIAFAISEFPKPSNTYHQSEFYDQLSKESIKAITDTLDAKDITRIRMPNGREIPFPAGTSEAVMSKVANEYNKILEREAAEKRYSFIAYASLWWLIPCLLLYVLGWSVGWVFRGFKPE
ncbi:MAG: hypothetical protein ACREBU_18755 [Nitrososphaera sp.]